MQKITITIISILIIFSNTYPQSDTSRYNNKKSEQIKKGWTFGAVPAIAFDSDIGFKYGAVVNLYNFGDGSTYPKYKHSLYFEWSRTTKGSGINQFIYDTEHLIPGIRLLIEASYLTEQNLDFYGFNGYKSLYNHSYEDKTDALYISRMYYKLDRKLTRIGAEFQGSLIGKKLRWVGGYTYFGNNIGTVDIERLNKGKEGIDRLPDTALLYDQYVKWNIIPADQAKGGNSHVFKCGIVYDTRDNEPNPMKGLWSEIILLYAAAPRYSFSKILITHRQYFTLAPKVLNLAYRIGYQGKLTGNIPFYMLPYIYNTAPNMTRDGLGGAKTMRGILRNRVVGDGMLYGNFELRWKFLRTVLFNQNIYIALSSFIDAGMVVQDYKINTTQVPSSFMYLFPDEKESIHWSGGAGIHFVLNENFIVTVDHGWAFNKNDGEKGLYINLNFLY
jgi:hypothetical protein